jgi:hypothetical protein
MKVLYRNLMRKSFFDSPPEEDLLGSQFYRNIAISGLDSQRLKMAQLLVVRTSYRNFLALMFPPLKLRSIT